MTQADRTRLDQHTVEASETALPASPVAGRFPVPAPAGKRLTHPAAILSGALRSGDSRGRLRTSVDAALSAETGHGLAFLFMAVMMGTGAGLFYMAPTDPPVTLLCLGFLLALLMALLLAETRPGAARMAGFAAALAAGALAAAVEVQRGAVLLDSDVTTTLTGVVEAREFDASGRTRYLIRLMSTEDPDIRRPPARVRLVARASHQPVPIGATIRGRARLSSPSGPVLPGGYDFAFRAFVDGIGAHGFFFQAPVRVPQTGSVRSSPDALIQAFRLGLRDLRERISARFRSVLPGDPGGIAAALAVSDRSGISEPTVVALRATGLAHILAISGLHMALAAGTLYIGVRKLLALYPPLVEAVPVKKIAAVGALMTATAYLLISGASVSTQRAWVMLCVMLIAVLADRPALTMRNVALAAMVIIVLTPSAVVGPGFQMSFSATAALISAYAVIARRDRTASLAPPGFFTGSPAGRLLAGLARVALGLAITSLVAGLATGLFSVHHFHRVAGHGVLANLLAMPLVTLVVMPAGLAALLLMPLGLDALPLQIMGKGLEGVIAAARLVEGLGGDITVGQVPLLATATAGAGIVLLVFLRSWLRLGGLVLVAIAAALALPPLARPQPDVLISEAGTLVALAGSGGLASNAARPPDFVFRQWQAALRQPSHLPPVKQQGGTPDDPDTLDVLLAAAELEPSRFQCAGRGVCVAIHHQLRIIAINQAALIGPGCDRADILVVAIPVYMQSCRSGALLVTARSLRRSGALALRMSPGGAGLTVEAALDGVIRPWTVQRYYDWRTGRYDLPG